MRLLRTVQRHPFTRGHLKIVPLDKIVRERVRYVSALLSPITVTPTATIAITTRCRPTPPSGSTRTLFAPKPFRKLRKLVCDGALQRGFAFEGAVDAVERVDVFCIVCLEGG